VQLRSIVFQKADGRRAANGWRAHGAAPADAPVALHQVVPASSCGRNFPGQATKPRGSWAWLSLAHSGQTELDQGTDQPGKRARTPAPLI